MAAPQKKKADGKVQFVKKAYQRTYSIAEISTILNLNQNTCREMAKKKIFPNLKIRTRIIVPCEAFDRWFDNLTPEQMVAITERYENISEGGNA